MIAIAIFVLVLSADLWTDLYRRSRDIPINHTRGAILRTLGLIPTVFCVHHNRGLLFPMEFVLYMILFNGIFGLVAHGNWFYLGDSKIDQIQKSMGIFAFIFQYFILIILVDLFIRL